jgi:hypothetical protein
MKMPHTEGKWPSEYGGRWFPEQRGNMSLEFQALLRSDTDRQVFGRGSSVQEIITFSKVNQSLTGLSPQGHWPSASVVFLDFDSLALWWGMD